MMRRFHWQPFVLLLLALVQPARAAETPLLTMGSEDLGHGYGPAKPALIPVILRSLEAFETPQLDDCLAENDGRKGDYASLFVAYRFANASGSRLWVVRPKLKPWCSILYGAHLFRYFLIEERPARSSPQYRLVMANGGDGLAVYPRISHGLNDILATGCNASQCWSSRMAYDGSRYRSVRCTRTEPRGDKEIDVPIRCEDDR
jgi:hypothetical protein